MQVIHNSPRCLIEEVAPGPTLAKLLAETDGSDENSAASLRRKAVLRTLTEFHRTVRLTSTCSLATHFLIQL